MGVCGCDSRPNLGEWDVRGISMDGPRELNGPVFEIGDVDLLGPTNVDVLGPTNVDVLEPVVFMPSGVVVDADTTDVEVVAEDKE